MVFRTIARREFDEAVDWYQQQAGLGEAFIEKVSQAVDRILENPMRYPVVHAGIHQALIDRFPYSLLYRCDDSALVVLAVYHHRRDPSGWMRRR